jgi:3'5'-cyclic nucleotide phosphodiesterase
MYTNNHYHCYVLLCATVLLLLTQQELPLLVAAVFAHSPLPALYSIQPQQFQKFVGGIAQLMVKPRVTYHGLYHAVDVLHAVWIMLYGSCGESVAKLLTPLSQFALMCGAVAHDLDHPGKCT